MRVSNLIPFLYIIPVLLLFYNLFPIFHKELELLANFDSRTYKIKSDTDDILASYKDFPILYAREWREFDFFGSLKSKKKLQDLVSELSFNLYYSYKYHDQALKEAFKRTLTDEISVSSFLMENPKFDLNLYVKNSNLTSSGFPVYDFENFLENSKILVYREDDKPFLTGAAFIEYLSSKTKNELHQIGYKNLLINLITIKLIKELPYYSEYINLKQSKLKKVIKYNLAKKLAEFQLERQLFLKNEKIDENILNFFSNANRENFQHEPLFHLLKIDLPTINEAFALQKKLKNGYNFKKAAREFSMDITALFSGDLGIKKLSTLEKPLKEIILTTPSFPLITDVIDNQSNKFSIYQISEPVTDNEYLKKYKNREVLKKITETLYNQNLKEIKAAFLKNLKINEALICKDLYF